MMEFVSGEQYSGLVDYMDEEWLREHRRRNNPRGYVPIIGILDLLRKAKAPSTIDYMSLDTEGSELDILEGFFEQTVDFKINLISVEFRYDTVLLSQYEHLLKPHGFVIDDIRGFDACFRNTQLPKHPAYSSMYWNPPQCNCDGCQCFGQGSCDLANSEDI